MRRRTPPLGFAKTPESMGRPLDRSPGYPGRDNPRAQEYWLLRAPVPQAMICPAPPGFLRPTEKRCPPPTWPRKSPEGWKTGTPRAGTSSGSQVLGFRALRALRCRTSPPVRHEGDGAARKT